MEGRIVKGIGGFYYVDTGENGIYECRAKGIFRKEKMKPLPGDYAGIAVLDEKEKTGSIEKILPRKNVLVRPAVANVDMALVIFAAARPDPNLNLLDRFLCMMEYQKVPVTICFNKCDLISGEERKTLEEIYAPAGYPLLFTSVKTGENVDVLQSLLVGRTVTVAGPSGVGKSSLINMLQENVHMQTGQVSDKIGRGKHTTRHSELISIGKDTFIMDTPGFSSMNLPGFEKEDLWTCYPEFAPYEPECRFIGCSHIKEPDCGVRQAVEEGRISKVRYDNYILLYEEMKNMRKY